MLKHAYQIYFHYIGNYSPYWEWYGLKAPVWSDLFVTTRTDMELQEDTPNAQLNDVCVMSLMVSPCVRINLQMSVWRH